MIQVLIVDDQSLIRTAVVELLRHETDIAVAGEAADGGEAVAAARALTPDVVLMDIRMPVTDGITATARIASDPALIGTRVLILTTFEDDENLFATLQAGASGFIGKGAEPQEIARAVRAVHAGDALLSPAATRTLIETYLAAPHPVAASTDALRDITVRELEVMTMVARGASNAEIAAALYISPLTAKTHVNRVMAKLGARDRAQLVIAAYETGIVRPGMGSSD